MTSARACALLSVVAMVACSDDGGTRIDAATDGAVIDGAVVDGAVIDGAVVDGAVIDAAVIDGAVIDAAVIDAAVIDAAVIDAAVIDATVVDATMVDAMVCREVVCGVTRLTPTGDLDTSGLASDGTHVYWSNDRAGVSRVPVGGGAVEVIAADQIVSGSISPGSDVALDATHIYWAFRDSGTVWRRSKAGGATELLITGQDGINRLALTATEVFWTNDLLDNVMRMPKAGGTPVAIATGQMGAYDLAVDATHVYWADQLGQGLRRAPLGGGAVETLVDTGGPRMLALDANDVYWLDEGAETIFRRPKAGGATATVISGVGYIYGFTIDATHLYWTTDDHVSRRPKTLATPAVALASCFADIYAPYLLRVNGATLYWATRYLSASDGIQQVPAQATCMSR